MIAIIKYLQARLKTVVVVCYALLAVTAASSLLVDTHHAHSWVEQHVPCFWSLFGFAAAATIIGVARWFGRSGIQAPTDFYTRSQSSEEEA
ncbi:hypothetical protein JWJ90_16140 [Desulfobulbus rhabdoformis]|jgi:predicted tellurium resistance membrane protein TerC|uniref:hypothetical protein n=1 Tax=Desulfobulbus rhabdoformis TaxID=34032 RepID=UPI00196406A7|nr:hypothetical protein [Desulfobulbus rhabdoformis]MBM9615799.1 hypothetical protein [Desulfobulbus rhabdoformis]